MKSASLVSIVLSILAMVSASGQSPLPAGSPASEKVELKGTILFLGDSITHAGYYVSAIEAVLLTAGTDPMPELINLGLPSETVTGLSEPAHPWPRPNVHERAGRAIDKIKPDLVFACYGMNDGIYYPFSEERFAAYQKGINSLIEKVHGAGAKLVLMTPPPFDPEPLRAKGKLKAAGAEEYSWMEIYEDYDTAVLAKYAEWILAQRDRVEGVIDLRSPVLAYTDEKRKTDSKFTLSGDGVHANAEGHHIMARAILEALGRDPAAVDALDPDLLAKVENRQRTLHNAWLSHVGHKRPGTRPGLPLETARIAVALPEPEKPAILFNGFDLKGWDGVEKIWSVEDGVIVGRNTETVPSSTYLFSAKEYREFRLVLDVKQTVSPDHSTMHSAVAALGERFADKGDNAHGFKGPLLMFCHDWGIWDAYRRNRIEPAGQKGGLKIKSEKVGDWNRCEILVIGNRIRFVANGELVFDYTEVKPEMLQKSPIGLQIHSNKRQQEYRFRGLILSESPEDKLVTLK